MKEKILILPGDGIGPEITAQAVRILGSVAPVLGLDLELEEKLIGGAAIDRFGIPLPPDTFRAARSAKAILIGPLGGPAWDNLEVSLRPEAALLALRRELGLFANLRPVKIHRSLAGASPLKEMVVEDIDLMIVRELTGGVYFGEPRGLMHEENGRRTGFNTMVYHEDEVRNITRVAFQASLRRRRLVTSVDKANMLETSRLWRQVVTEEAANFPGVTLKHMYIDNCAMQMIIKPSQFDVILTSNLFGDIISDEAAVLGGSVGMHPSASLGPRSALYETIHGSEPEMAGQDKANPIGSILSVALMLRQTFGREDGAGAVEKGVEEILNGDRRTPDIWSEGKVRVGTAVMGEMILDGTMKHLTSGR